MRWESNGLILNFSKYNEKSYILEIFTEEHGKHKGIIRGLHSKNKRSIIEPGNEVFATWSGRLETHLGNYNVEPIKLWSSHILQFKDKLSAISSICYLISLTMAERQPNPIIYFSSKKSLFVDHLTQILVLQNFCFRCYLWRSKMIYSFKFSFLYI